MKNKNFYPMGYDYTYYQNLNYRSLNLDEQSEKGRKNEAICLKCALFLCGFALTGIILALIL